MLLFTLLLAVCAMTTRMASKNPLLDANRMALIDGRPRFLLGLYENPADDEKLRQAVEAGFNLFYCGADAKALDRLQRLGAKGWINLGEALDISVDTERRRASLLSLVNRFKNHPALLLWEGPDEALWNNSWTVYSYLNSEEFPAMRRAIEEQTGGQEELRALFSRMQESLARGLLDRFEAARTQFWRLLGRAAPRPDLRLDDALARARRMADGMTAGLRVVRQADPNHLLWLNHAPRNSLASLRLYNREADMAGCDIYPIPFNLLVGHSDLTNLSPASVGEYTDRMRAAAPGKACAMVLQGFGWRDLQPPAEREKDPRIGRRPTYAESRFMAFNAILHGANALLYWGTVYAKDEPSGVAAGDRKTGETQLWKDLLVLAREIRALEPAILAPEVRPVPKAVVEEGFGSNDGTGIRLSLRRVGEEYVLFAANETVHGLAFTVRGLPAELEGKTLYRLSSEETCAVKGRAFRDGVRSFDVHIYATSRRFEPQTR